MCRQLAEDPHKEIYVGGKGEIVEKKSRFISETSRIENEDEAIAFVEQIRKKYWDARHHCYAFSIGRNNELYRCSDDGEPSGTAGKPILDVLQKEEIHNGIIVVTRYFGGTLLGTGGLTRAYLSAAKEGLKNSRLIEKNLCQSIKIATDYNYIGKIQYIAASLGIPQTSSRYTENVVLAFLPKDKEVENFCRKIVEITSGRADINMGELCYAAMIDHEVIRF